MESSPNPIHQHFLEGISLRDTLKQTILSWPEDSNRRIVPDDASLFVYEELVLEIERWFHTARRWLRGIGSSQEDDMRFENALRTIRVHPLISRRAPVEVAERVEEAFDLILRRLEATAEPAGMSFQPNTGFILMWMDKSRPELEDVLHTFKDVFASFGIKAFRADELEHQDLITSVVLDSIKRCEFLVADLTGARPNVYYEVGYAHAVGKRPILYRRTGTPLHFDLSVHNIPEYRNNSELRQMFTRRLEHLLDKRT